MDMVAPADFGGEAVTFTATIINRLYIQLDEAAALMVQEQSAHHGDARRDSISTATVPDAGLDVDNELESAFINETLMSCAGSAI